MDDSSSVRNDLRAVFSAPEFKVLEAADGEQAVRTVADHPDIDLVICDVNMPKMNGIEVLERFKKDPAQANVPVMMLTMESRPSLIQRAKKIGALGWAVKPFKPRLLLAAVNKITRANKTKANGK